MAQRKGRFNGPVAFKFRGDKEAAQQYTNEARKMLDYANYMKSVSDVPSYFQSKTLDNGVKISVNSLPNNINQATISVPFTEEPFFEISQLLQFYRATEIQGEEGFPHTGRYFFTETANTDSSNNTIFSVDFETQNDEEEKLTDVIIFPQDDVVLDDQPLANRGAGPNEWFENADYTRVVFYSGIGNKRYYNLFHRYNLDFFPITDQTENEDFDEQHSMYHDFYPRDTQNSLRLRTGIDWTVTRFTGALPIIRQRNAGDSASPDSINPNISNEKPTKKLDDPLIYEAAIKTIDEKEFLIFVSKDKPELNLLDLSNRTKLYSFDLPLPNWVTIESGKYPFERPNFFFNSDCSEMASVQYKSTRYNHPTYGTLSFNGDDLHEDFPGLVRWNLKFELNSDGEPVQSDINIIEEFESTEYNRLLLAVDYSIEENRLDELQALYVDAFEEPLGNDSSYEKNSYLAYYNVGTLKNYKNNTTPDFRKLMGGGIYNPHIDTLIIDLRESIDQYQGLLRDVDLRNRTVVYRWIDHLEEISGALVLSSNDKIVINKEDNEENFVSNHSGNVERIDANNYRIKSIVPFSYMNSQGELEDSISIHPTGSFSVFVRETLTNYINKGTVELPSIDIIQVNPPGEGTKKTSSFKNLFQNLESFSLDTNTSVDDSETILAHNWIWVK